MYQTNFSFIASTVNSGELRIPYPVPYPVPVCVTGNLWLVKFNGFILQLMAKTNHKFPDHANRNYYERDTEFEVLLNSLYQIPYILKMI